MLFVIIAEGVGGMLHKAKEVGLIHGFSVENSVTEVSHLQFADGSLIFCDASIEEVNCLKGILLWFEVVSGLKINYGKCEMLGVRPLMKLMFPCSPWRLDANLGGFLLDILVCLHWSA